MLRVSGTGQHASHSSIVSVVLNGREGTSGLTASFVLRISIVAWSYALHITFPLVRKGPVIVQTRRTDINTNSCDVVLEGSTLTARFASVSRVLSPQVPSDRACLNAGGCSVMGIPVVTVDSRAVKWILHTSPLHLLAPRVQVAGLDAVPCRQSSMDPLRVPVRRTNLDASQTDLISEGLLRLRTLFDTTSGEVISELKSLVSEGGTYRYTDTVIALGHDIAVVPVRTLEHALLAYVISEHVVKCVVNSRIRALTHTHSLIIEVLSVLV